MPYQNNEDSGTEPFRKLFVGGLHAKTDVDTLKQYFGQWGEVENAVISKDRSTGRSRGFAFVTFSNMEDLDKVQAARPHSIDNKDVETKRPAPREESDDSRLTVSKIFVAKLPKTVTTDTLKEYFSIYGTVVAATIVMDQESGESKGFGFVTFDDYDAVDKIILHKPISIADTVIDVKKGLSKEQLQEVKTKQAQKAAYGNGGGPPMMMNNGPMYPPPQAMYGGPPVGYGPPQPMYGGGPPMQQPGGYMPPPGMYGGPMGGGMQPQGGYPAPYQQMPPYGGGGYGPPPNQYQQMGVLGGMPQNPYGGAPGYRGGGQRPSYNGNSVGSAPRGRGSWQPRGGGGGRGGPPRGGGTRGNRRG